MSQNKSKEVQQTENSTQIAQDIMKRCRGQIFYEHPNQQALGYGSGYLISKNMVLTPASNIYDKVRRTYHQNIKFSFKIGSTNKIIPCRMENIYVSNEFIQQLTARKLLFDYALIKLEDELSVFYDEDEEKFMKSNILQEYYKIILNDLKLRVKQCQEIIFNKDKIIFDVQKIIQKLNQQNQLLKKNFQEIKQDLANYQYQSIKAKQIFNQKNKQAIKLTNVQKTILTKWISNSIEINHSRIIRISAINGQYQKIVSLKPLNAAQQISFKVFKYGGTGAISFGLITETKRYERYSGQYVDQKQTIGLWTDPIDRDGWININSIKKVNANDSLFAQEGQLIKIKIEKQKIIFQKGYINFQSFQLENCMKEVLLYPFVALWGKGDEIQIIYKSQS